MSVNDDYVRGIAEAASQRRRQLAIATADNKRNSDGHGHSNGNSNGADTNDSVMHQLDYECFDALVAIEKAYEVLDRTLQLRVEKWV